jgi:catechol 2,3-dioxygenase-like lactoylglutathione lyase family enzyme
MQSINLFNLQLLKLPRVGQLGFVVRSIPASKPAYASLYNLDAWFKPNYKEMDFTAGGAKIELDFQIAFAFSGNLQVELVQAPAGENIYAHYLAQAGEGLHHLGFFLSDLDRRMAVARQAGLPVLLEGRLTLAGKSRARFAYLDTRLLCGIIVELIEIKTMGVSLPQTGFTMRIGGITGDVHRI